MENELIFQHHVLGLTKKAEQKLHTFSRILKYMNINKKNTFIKDFILSQFSYDPLVRIAVDVFKVNNALLTCLMKETFLEKIFPHTPFKEMSVFRGYNIKSVKSGMQSGSYF